MYQQKVQKEENSSSSKQKKKISEWWNNRKQRIHRQIEYARLKRIRKNTVPPYTYCKNCGTRLEGMYCYQCGQYALDPRQPFQKYVKQYFENVYQYDSKIWRTVWILFSRPGFLTREFNDGKISSYVHPFRLYMFISVVFFTIFFMLTSDKIAHVLLNVNAPKFSEQVIAQLKSGKALPDTTVFAYHGYELQEALKSQGVQQADSLIQVIPLSTHEKTLSKVCMPCIVFNGYYRPTRLRDADQDEISKYLETVSLTESIDEKVLYPMDSIINQMDEDEQNIFKTFDLTTNFRLDSLDNVHSLVPIYDWNNNETKYLNQLRGESFFNELLGELSKWTPFYMMFLLPVLALFFRLAYHKQRMPYMWHFVHAIHINTVFLFLLPIPLFPIFLADNPNSIFPQTAQLLLLFSIGLFVYTYISQYTVYRDGWIRTLFKSLLIYVSFSVLSIGIALSLLLWLLYIIGGNIL